MTRPLPTTMEILEALAYKQPQKPSVRDGRQEFTALQFYAMVWNCALKMRALGVRPGQTVAISGPGFALELVLLLAAEGLGAVTASFQAQNDVDAPAIFERADWVFSAVPQPVPPRARLHLVDAAFAGGLDAPLQPSQRPWVVPDMDAPQRISRTSGSTGRSKLMLLRRHAQDTWMRSILPETSYFAHSRLLVLGPFVMNVAFTRACRCLRANGMVMAGPGSLVGDLAPTDVWGLPAHLERFLDDLPAGYVSPQPVAVSTVGGSLPPALRSRADAVFRGRVINRYGSNEVGAVCEDLDASGAGVITPGVDVRILGPDGAPVPDGTYGVIAVRSTCMVEGYLDAPEATAASFRDGWFVSADVGALVGPRHLRLAGRQDDLINLGGLKIPAASVEAQLAGQPAIADCAAIAVMLQGGAVTLGLAVVLAEGRTLEEASAQVQSALKLGPGTAVRVLPVPALPRLPSGKLDRVALQRMFLQNG